jgi:GNAT superfamily N-acetyltransferase
MVDIIKAGVEDYEVVYGLAEKVWPQTYNKILSPEQVTYMFDMMYSAASYADQIRLQGHHFLLAAEDGKYLGFASYELNYRMGATKIHKLYVLPNLQGKGVGRLLVSKIESIAKKHGNDKITLNVNRFNEAVLFYTAAGFSKTGQEDISIGNGYLMEDFIMEKGL